ncbi:MAG: ribosome-associated translation inhibitor RaiA [Candidatus Omnitrophota bacterium]
MNIVITGRHFDITEGIKSHVNDKIVKLDKFFTKILEAHVILAVEKFRHIAEVTLMGKDLKITATETTSDMYASIDGAIGSLDKQLRKFHERLREHKMKQAHKVKVDAVKSAYKSSDSEKSGEEITGIVEIRSFSEKPMSIEEAAEELKISSDEFLVFRNSDDERINVMYRRKDGKFGLIRT